MGYVSRTLLTAGTMLSGLVIGLTAGGGGDEPADPRAVAFDETPDGQILLDAADCVIEANAAARRLLDSEALTRGEDVTATLPELSSLVASAAGEETELPLGSGADRRYLTARCVDLSGETQAAKLLTVRDVTETRRDAKRHRAFLEHSPELVLVLDSDGTATFVGPSCPSVLGYEPSALVGEELVTRIHPEDREPFEDGFEAVLAEPGATERFEYRIQTRDGDWRILDGVGTNLLEEPAVSGVLLAGRDVTESTQRKYELERQNERLDEFASVLSHDLRSPLQVATLSLERANRTGEQEAFEKTADAHDRIETIITNVLALARQGQSVTEPTDVGLEEVARDAWETVDTQMMTLTVDRDRRLQADRDRLKQLFENLFRNAAEHAGADATVTVGPIEPMHTTTRISSGGRNGFYVADDGPGIPPEEREDVFDSGFTTTAEGTGFGLAIVEQIADAHRWETTITESRDGGARFEFTERAAESYLSPD